MEPESAGERRSRGGRARTQAGRAAGERPRRSSSSHRAHHKMAAGGRRDVPRRRQRRTDPRAREGGSKHEARGGAAGFVAVVCRLSLSKYSTSPPAPRRTRHVFDLKNVPAVHALRWRPGARDPGTLRHACDAAHTIDAHHHTSRHLRPRVTRAWTRSRASRDVPWQLARAATPRALMQLYGCGRNRARSQFNGLSETPRMNSHAKWQSRLPAECAMRCAFSTG